MLEVRDLGLPGVREIVPRRFGDARGWFVESWNAARFADHGLQFDWVQDNQAFSAEAGTLRGMHWQRPPTAQTKLVRCLRGRVYDVAVDIRAGSPTFGKWVGLELTGETGNQILVPRGFAHAYLTLTPDAEVAYKVDAPYSAADEGAFRYDDPAVGIEWPWDGELLLSDKDAAAPLLADVDTGFSA